MNMNKPGHIIIEPLNALERYDPLKIHVCLRWCYFRGGRPEMFKLLKQFAAICWFIPTLSLQSTGSVHQSSPVASVAAGEVATFLPSIAGRPTTSHFSKARGGTRWIGKKSCYLAFLISLNFTELPHLLTSIVTWGWDWQIESDTGFVPSRAVWFPMISSADAGSLGGSSLSKQY